MAYREIIRALKDKEYGHNLTEEQDVVLPERPAGLTKPGYLYQFHLIESYIRLPFLSLSKATAYTATAQSDQIGIIQIRYLSGLF
jgi:mersacidin/lichenicidin family type 2 lantibiotic